MQDMQEHPSAVRFVDYSYLFLLLNCLYLFETLRPTGIYMKTLTTRLQSFLGFLSINKSYLMIVIFSVELSLLIRNLASYGDIHEDPPTPLQSFLEGRK